MATLEHEQLLPGARAGVADEHVFVSHDGRRQRIVRAASLVAGGLALVWLAALGLALAGSTRLPGLPLPAAKESVPAPAPAQVVAPVPSAPRARAHAPAPTRPAPVVRPIVERPATVHLAPRMASAPAPAAPAVHRSRAAAVTPAPPPAPAATAPQRGWERRGWTAPPGQTRRTDPASRGSGHSSDAGASGTTTTHGNGHGNG
jgi:hypothetical protein